MRAEITVKSGANPHITIHADTDTERSLLTMLLRTNKAPRLSWVGSTAEAKSVTSITIAIEDGSRKQ